MAPLTSVFLQILPLHLSITITIPKRNKLVRFTVYELLKSATCHEWCVQLLVVHPEFLPLALDRSACIMVARASYFPLSKDDYVLFYSRCSSFF
jgi:hypothetical protein